MSPEEREWLAQEQAAAFERNNGADVHDGALSAGYVAIARALRQPIEVQLPADFAARLAAMATQQRSAVEVESGLEKRLLLILGIIFGVAALVVGLIFGASWIAPVLGQLDQLGQSSLSLLLGLLACLGGSAVAQRLPLLLGRKHQALA